MRERYSPIFIIVVMVIATVFVRSSNAQGLLGKRYTGFQIGLINPGDNAVEEIDDSILLFGGGFNIPINPNVDAIVSLSYAKLEGTMAGTIQVEATNTGIVGGINYHFTPEQKTNPFVGIHVGIISSEADMAIPGYSASTDEDDFTIAVVGGVEVDLNEKVAIRPTISYEKIDEEDDFFTGINLSMWFNESVFGSISVSYGFDDGDIVYAVGVGFGY